MYKGYQDKEARKKYMREYKRDYRQSAVYRVKQAIPKMVSEDLRKLGIDLTICDWWKPR